MILNTKRSRPPARFDGQRWVNARLEEAAAPTGPWTQVETFLLSPPDADPEFPEEREFTTEDATLTPGWYRLVYIDESGDQFSAEPVAHPIENALRPAVADVGAIIRRRTLDVNGAELGTFTTATHVSAVAVEGYIDHAVDEVSLHLPVNLPERHVAMARRLVAIRAAMSIELSYWPEQADGDETAYGRLREMYESGLRTLVAVLTDTDQGVPSRFVSIGMVSPYSTPRTTDPYLQL